LTGLTQPEKTLACLPQWLWA